MQGQHQAHPKLFYQVTLEELVPQDDFYRALERAIDLSFVRRRTAYLYSYTGRPSVDTEVIIKLLLVAYIEGITSERQLMRQVQVNLSYRRYIGYDLDEAVPDHSAISRNRSLFGKELFQEIFDHVVKLCIQAGLVAGVHQSVDRTAVQANASMDSLVPREVISSPERFVDQVFAENPVEPEEEKGKLITVEANREQLTKLEPRQATLALGQPRPGPQPKGHMGNVTVLSAVPGTSRKPPPGRASNDLYYSKTDPEAEVVSPRGKPTMLAYGVHVSVDSRANVITALRATNASLDDPIPVPQMLQYLKGHLGLPVATVAADKRYGRGWFYERLALMGIKAYIPRRKYGNVHKGFWDFSYFKYHPEEDVYTCPDGKKLRLKGFDWSGRQWHYQADRVDCHACALRPQCTNNKAGRRVFRSVYQPHYAEADCVQAGPGSRLARIRRKTTVETVFADTKTRHGLGRAKYRGLRKFTAQALLSATAYNLKKLLRRGRRVIVEAMALALPSTAPRPCPLIALAGATLFAEQGYL